MILTILDKQTNRVINEIRVKREIKDEGLILFPNFDTLKDAENAIKHWDMDKSDFHILTKSWKQNQEDVRVYMPIRKKDLEYYQQLEFWIVLY